LEDQARTPRQNAALDDFFGRSETRLGQRPASKGAIPAPQNVPSCEAMLPCVRGEIRSRFHADDLARSKPPSLGRDAIITRLSWLAAATRGCRRASATNRIPVIYGDLSRGPCANTSTYDGAFQSRQVLLRRRRGVAFNFGSDSFNAAMSRISLIPPPSPSPSAARGRSDQVLTLYPAQIAGVRPIASAPSKPAGSDPIAVDGRRIRSPRQLSNTCGSPAKKSAFESRHKPPPLRQITNRPLP